MENVNLGSEQVAVAGKTMGEIVASVSRAASIMNEISEASQEQSAGIESITRAISQIDTVTQDNGKLVGDISKTAGMLNEQAKALLKAVSDFDLGTAEYGDTDDARALVQRAVAFCANESVDKLVLDINSLSKGSFLDRDLYLLVIRLSDGQLIAHGSNPRLIGADALQYKDAAGKLFGKEMITLAKSSGSGWVNYKFAHPVTGEVAQKSSYVVRVQDVLVACGAYAKEKKTVPALPA